VARLRAAVAASLREFQRHGGEVPARGGRRRGGGRPHEPWLSRPALRELNATIWVLRRLGYIGPDDDLTIRGHMLRALFHPAGMALTELVMSGALADLGPAELSEVVSWFTFDDDRPLRNLDTPARRIVEVRREVYRVLGLVQSAEYEAGVAMSPGVTDSFHGVALNWWRGMSLGGLLRRVDLAEGDLLVSLNQTIDLLQQLQGAVGQALDARDLWRADMRGAGSGRRSQKETREQFARLRPALEAAWTGLLRGSVAQSRAIPSMVTTAAAAVNGPTAQSGAVAPTGVPLPMAEDEDAADALQDRVESDTGPEIEADREPE
jgi:hypothetical protein